MTEHTPGPWQERKSPYGWDIFGGDGLWIASVQTPVMGAAGYPEPAAVESNARLIAATTDLLAVLARFVRIRDWCHDETSDACREYDNAADEARAAIARARGDTSNAA